MSENKEETVYRNLSGPLMASWDVTHRCNMFCRHCFNGSQVTRVADDELVAENRDRLLSELIELKLNSVCLCGGEPMLRKDIVHIVTKLAEGGILVNMVSNGLLMTDEKIEELKGKLFHLQISIDGARAETHDTFRNTRNAFDRATRALKSAVQAGILTSSSFCPTRHNFRELPQYVDLISDLGCRKIRMMQLLPQSRGLVHEELALSEREVVEFHWMLNDLQRKNPHMSLEYGDPLQHILSFTRQGIDTCTIEIRPNGDLAISPYLPLIFGNVKKITIKEAWKRGLRGAWRHPETLKVCSQITSIADLARFDNPWEHHVEVI